MERLTKAYEDGTHAAADNLPCGETAGSIRSYCLISWVPMRIPGWNRVKLSN